MAYAAVVLIVLTPFEILCIGSVQGSHRSLMFCKRISLFKVGLARRPPGAVAADDSAVAAGAVCSGAAGALGGGLWGVTCLQFCFVYASRVGEIRSCVHQMLLQG